MNPKPSTCCGCPLEFVGQGFAPPSGPPGAPLLFVGEALGHHEALRGEVFVGDAGAMLNRILSHANIPRESVRIANICSCRPPGNELEGMPYAAGAIAHCRVHLDPILAEGSPVVVPLGTTALRSLLHLEGQSHVSIQNFHGTVSRPAGADYLVVPTFHPSYLQRGATHLLDTVRHDLSTAQRVACEGYHPPDLALVVDPEVQWFAAWVENLVAAAVLDPDGVWLNVDVETPEKIKGRDESELSAGLKHDEVILRINFGCRADEGITVPWIGPYVPLIKRALAAPCVHMMWHYDFDLPRILKHGCVVNGRIWDLMWAWHVLQSDLPRGLGFAAPLLDAEDKTPWKHLAAITGYEGDYAAMDGVKPFRMAQTLVKDLLAAGMWDVFQHHIMDIDQYVMKPLEKVGLLIDPEAIAAFKTKLETSDRRILHAIQAAVPDTMKPRTPKEGLKHDPGINAVHTKGRATTKAGKPKKVVASDVKQELFAQSAIVVEQDIEKLVQVCSACNAVDIAKSHRCTDKTLVPNVILEVRTVHRYFWQEPFSPDSPQQVLNYALARGHKPGKQKKTKLPTMDRQTLERIGKTTKDPLYALILDHRAVGKVLGTYVEGTLKRLGDDGRVHPTVTWKPSTLRPSCVNPNLFNVVTDRGGKDSLAAGFRKCIVAEPGCVLVEFDFAGIEAVLSGWFMQDAGYMRLAKLGMHAYVASHVLNRPADLAWSDADLATYFAEIKKSPDETVKEIYARSKRCVHGEAYGLTVYGMQQTYPETFPTMKDAQRISDIYHAIAPKLPQWHQQLQLLARRRGYLGGPGEHPFGARHWYWAVFTYKHLTRTQYQNIVVKYRRMGKEAPVELINGEPFGRYPGPDAKRAIAFFPQSTARFVMTEAAYRLMHPDSASYVGDLFHGRTPLRATVYDSLLFEVPKEQVDFLTERVVLEMSRAVPELPLTDPEAAKLFGPFLSIGVDAKIGPNWLDMDSLDVAGIAEAREYLPVEGDDEDEERDLGRRLYA